MKKTSYFYLIMTILFSLLGCCSPEEAQPQPEPQKKYSYTVNITNASDFSGCTFEYIFYVDGEKEDVQSTADSCVTFTTLKEGSVKVDVTAKNSSGKVVGNRIGKTCYATTSVLLPFEEVAVLDSISILTPESYVYEGESVKLTIKALYSDGSDRDVTTSAFYTSDDSSILTVSNIGEVIGVKKGIATIKVTYTCEGVTKEDSINFEVLDK
ncbi:MAG: Ig-like domain-containing protein, partial [Spirochaetales bacterium]|nr:Ig-like domain-containing protein [Spirochaetales bacterium]